MTTLFQWGEYRLFQRQKRYLVNPEVKDITFLSIGGEYFLRDMYMGK